MKMRFIAMIYLMLNSCDGFLQNIKIPSSPCRYCRKVRLQYSFLLKKNDIYLEPYTKDSVIENMIIIVKDDLSNDFLYFMKFYNLLSDEQSSYLYIILYEMMSFVIRNENKIAKLHISFINIFAYILIKNIILNHYVHHLY